MIFYVSPTRALVNDLHARLARFRRWGCASSGARATIARH